MPCTAAAIDCDRRVGVRYRSLPGHKYDQRQCQIVHTNSADTQWAFHPPASVCRFDRCRYDRTNWLPCQSISFANVRARMFDTWFQNHESWCRMGVVNGSKYPADVGNEESCRLVAKNSSINDDPRDDDNSDEVFLKRTFWHT
eukprot:scaffold3007_cov157-Amphora_coffeaeformis.AAC.6